jgi:hypothetical protein
MKFEKQKLTGDVTIDYNEFVDCEFENCTIFYHGGDFKLTRVKFVNVRFGLAHSANSTLMFLRFLRDVLPKSFEELLANVSKSTPQSGKVN